MPMKKIRLFLLSAMMCVLCVGQAGALEYTIDAPEDYLFGRPTSEDTIYEAEEINVDRSKNTALIPPTFGSPTSYLPGSGTPLSGRHQRNRGHRHRDLHDLGKRDLCYDRVQGWHLHH